MTDIVVLAILLIIALVGLALVALPIYFALKNPPSWVSSVICLIVLYSVVVVAGPNFLKFKTVSRQSEARTNLGAIFTTQVSYFSENNTYSKMLNWAPEGESRYAYFAGDDFITNTRGVPVTCRPDGNWPFTLRPASSDTGFTAMAIGNTDDDSDLDVWVINDAKVLVNLQNDEAKKPTSRKEIGFYILFALLVIAFIVDFRRGSAAGISSPRRDGTMGKNDDSGGNISDQGLKK